MSNELKCPFCNRNLHKGEDGIYSHLDYMTECKGRLFDGSKELWQELIRTKKQLVTKCNQLEIAVDALRRIKFRGKHSKYECCKISGIIAQDVLEKITTLEQKDVK